MRSRVLTSIGLMALSGVVSLLVVAAQSATDSPKPITASPGSASRTPWGDPDLQGIWTDVYETPLQRPAQVRGPGVPDRGGSRRPGQTAIGDPPARPPRAAGERAGRLRRLQRGVRDGEAHRPAHVARRRSARRPNSCVHPGRAQANGRVSRVPARADAGHRNVQEAGASLSRRILRPAVTAEGGAAPDLQHGPAESQRWSGGPQPGGTLHGRRAAGLQRVSSDRAVARCGGDFLRHRSGARMAARHPGQRQPAPAAVGAAALRRLTWPMGGQHARRRRHQLRPEDRLSRLPRAPAPGRTLYTAWMRAHSSTS